ncbi:PREDICTED: BTB/POZ domain-containing protein 6-B-like [Acropora digitifera]|uniref:BTB/POZ domain-containing protein 6-B-like n=1 Tax=Acropora digitifera TaxID=70779 RepID=UPI00077AA1F3|nr:PREDICTED: BTB/POZ domain-containing protein 6-B-like [Acropora digitifera]
MASKEENEGWQTTRKTLTDRVEFLLNNSLMSDVSFVVRNASGEEESLAAHKFVLAVSSPVFYAMFYGELAESKNTIVLPDCDSESFLEFLRFLYSDKVQLSGRCVMQVSYLAKKYIVPELETECTNFLKENLSPENVFDILPLAKAFDEEELVVRCWEVVDRSTQVALQSEAFASISKELLQEVVKRDDLMIHEIELFQAVDRWATAECERKDLEPVKGSKRIVTGEEILSNIRFPLMSQDQFAEKVSYSGLLSKDEIIDMFRCFSGVPVSGLKFIKRPRKLIPPPAFSRCKRFPQVSCGWSYSDDKNDVLVFSVDSPVFIRGVRLFGSKGLAYDVFLELRSLGEYVQLCSVDSSFMTDNEERNGYYGFDVVFDHPIPLHKNVRYEICAKISGPSSWYGSSGLGMVDCNGIHFKFSRRTSPNGTNESEGQFAEILFQKY